MNIYWFCGIAATVLIAVITLAFKIGDWRGHVDSDRDTFKKFITEVRDDIKEILKRLPPDTVKGTSPLQLTELGESISEELKASDWAKGTAPLLIAQIRGKHPYEIQEFCLEYATKLFTPSEDLDRKIQTCAYQKGISKEQVLRVLAVELRDELLKEMGIKQDND